MLVLALVIGQVLVFGTASLHLGSIAPPSDPNDFLLDYQIEKLAGTGSADVVFVGDSSLGNSIDAAEASRLLGVRCVSLALTGSYGYPGSLSMLRVSLRRFTPRLIVLMQTMEMATNEPAYRGHARTLLRTSLGLDMGKLPLAIQYRTLLAGVKDVLDIKELLRIGKWLAGRGPPPITAADAIVADYVKQVGRWPHGKPIDAARSWESPAELTDAAFLDEAVRVAKEAGVRLVYAHGPMREAIVEANSAYLEAVNALLVARGLEVLPGSPLRIPLEKVGDSEDHVAPEAKTWATGEYGAWLAPLLTSRAPTRP